MAVEKISNCPLSDLQPPSQSEVANMHHTNEARSGSNSGEARTYSKLVGYVRRSPRNYNAVVELKLGAIVRRDFKHVFQDVTYAKLRIDGEKLLAVLRGERAVVPVLVIVTDDDAGAQ